MADEATDEVGGGSSASVLKKYGPLAAIVLLAQIVLSWVVLQMIFKDRLSGQAEGEGPNFEAPTVVEQGTGGAGEQLPFYFAPPALKDVTFNPAGTNASRFAVITIELGLVDERPKGKRKDAKALSGDTSIQDRINLNLGKIQDIIQSVLRAQRIDQFESENIAALKDELRQAINQGVLQKIFKADNEDEPQIRVQEVVFTRLIIQ